MATANYTVKKRIVHTFKNGTVLTCDDSVAATSALFSLWLKEGRIS